MDARLAPRGKTPAMPMKAPMVPGPTMPTKKPMVPGPKAAMPNARAVEHANPNARFKRPPSVKARKPVVSKPSVGGRRTVL